MPIQTKTAIHAQHKFQSILSYPAVIVPSLSEDEIKITLLEAILSYLEDNLPLEIMISLATTIQQYMGLRGKDCRELDNALTTLTTLTEYLGSNKKIAESHINEILLETLDSFTTTQSRD